MRRQRMYWVADGEFHHQQKFVSKCKRMDISSKDLCEVKVGAFRMIISIRLIRCRHLGACYERLNTERQKSARKSESRWETIQGQLIKANDCVDEDTGITRGCHRYRYSNEVRHFAESIYEHKNNIILMFSWGTQRPSPFKQTPRILSWQTEG